MTLRRLLLGLAVGITVYAVLPKEKPKKPAVHLPPLVPPTPLPPDRLL